MHEDSAKRWGNHEESEQDDSLREEEQIDEEKSKQTTVIQKQEVGNRPTTCVRVTTEISFLHMKRTLCHGRVGRVVTIPLSSREE